jgi:hypothetical protein
MPNHIVHEVSGELIRVEGTPVKSPSLPPITIQRRCFPLYLGYPPP